MGLKHQNHQRFQVFIGLTSSFVGCLKALCGKEFRAKSIQLILQPQIISDHRNEFRICGFTTIILDCISKIRIKRIHVASIPRDLDSVADGALDAAGSGLVFLCHGGVEHLDK